MGVSRRHHILPIAYLKGWSGESTHLLSRDLKPVRATRSVSVRDAAVSKNRNKDILMGNHGLQPTHLEDSVLQLLDGEAATIFRKLRAPDRLTLDKDDELLLKEFMAHQMTRSDFQLERNEALIIQRHGDSVLSALDPGSHIGPLQQVVSDSDGAISENDVVRHFALSSLMADVERHFKDLVPRHVRVYETAAPLVTCDEPVVPLFMSMKRPRQDLCCAPVVVFPVSSTRVMMLFHPRMPKRLPGGETLTVSEVADLNRVIAGNATRFVFGDPSFSEIDKISVPSSVIEIYDGAFEDHPDEFLAPSAQKRRRQLIIGDHGRWDYDADAPTRPVGRLWPWWRVETSGVARYNRAPISPKYSMLGYSPVSKEAS